ncbi:MAG: methytransferase partner Trm112 [Candidatus Thermoplasmatota archaeon]
MRRDLMEIICCPVCKGDLSLTVTKEDEHEILEGTLRCPKCDFDYPIEDGIPNLLPPEMHEKR